MSILGWTCGTCGNRNTALALRTCSRCGLPKSGADDPSVKQFTAVYATLRSAKDFARDAQELARRGWRVASQSSMPIGMGHNITQITVTYTRE